MEIDPLKEVSFSHWGISLGEKYTIEEFVEELRGLLKLENLSIQESS